jgi:hypothetical protein
MADIQLVEGDSLHYDPSGTGAPLNFKFPPNPAAGNRVRLINRTSDSALATLATDTVGHTIQGTSGAGQTGVAWFGAFIVGEWEFHPTTNTWYKIIEKTASGIELFNESAGIVGIPTTPTQIPLVFVSGTGGTSTLFTPTGGDLVANLDMVLSLQFGVEFDVTATANNQEVNVWNDLIIVANPSGQSTIGSAIIKYPFQSSRAGTWAASQSSLAIVNIQQGDTLGMRINTNVGDTMVADLISAFLLVSI